MAPLAQPPPAGLTYSAILPFVVASFSIQCLFCGSILTLLVILLNVARQQQRRRAEFAISIVSALLFLVLPITGGLSQVPADADPSLPLDKATFYANEVLVITIPFIADLAITARVLTFFPSRTSSLRTRVLVMCFPVAVKCCRLAGLVYFCHYMWKVTSVADSVLTLNSAAGGGTGATPELYLEYVGQFLDALYSTCICVWRLWRIAHPLPRSAVASRSSQLQARVSQVLRVLLASFVCPAASALALVVVASGDSFEAIGYMSLLNPGIVVVNVLASGILLAMRPQGSARRASATSGDPEAALVAPAAGGAARRGEGARRVAKRRGLFRFGTATPSPPIPTPDAAKAPQACGWTPRLASFLAASSDAKEGGAFAVAPSPPGAAALRKPSVGSDAASVMTELRLHQHVESGSQEVLRTMTLPRDGESPGAEWEERGRTWSP